MNYTAILSGIGTVLNKAVSPFTKYIVFAAIMALTASGFYFYYNASQKQIKELIDAKAKAEVTVAIQNKTIEDMQFNENVRKFILKQVYEELAEARKQDEKPEPTSPFVDPTTQEPVDLDKALQKDLGVTEDYINKQYNDTNKCVSLYSGVPVTELEKNKDEQDKLLRYCGISH